MRAHRARLLLLGSLACVPPERGIDNTRIVGEVQIGPLRIEEPPDGDFGGLGMPEELPRLYVSTQLVSGTLGDVGPDAPDVDAFLLSSRLALPGQALDVHLTDPSASVVAELYDLERYVEGSPLVLASATIAGSGTLVFPDVEPGIDTGFFLGDSGLEAGPRMMKDVDYGLRLVGVAGSSVAYEVVVPGASPGAVELKVGAWSSSDPASLGNPLAGTTLTRWRGGGEADGYVWTGSYAMYLVRSVHGEGLDVTLEEGANEAWLFAGDWATLNSPLASGTWYSSEPAHVTLPKKDPEGTFFEDAVVVEVEQALVLDTFAEAIVLQELAEGDTEPNDLQGSWPPAVNLATSADAIDAGLLSGPGFADRFTGSIVYGPEPYSYPIYGHDSDAWRFQVPEPSRLVLTLTWDDASACLDAFVVDAVDGVGLDYAATFDLPDVGGGEAVYEPGVDYYLVVLGYVGAPEGASAAYDLLVEQVAP